jgi:hypothetical protein
MLRFLPGALGLVACTAAVVAEIDKPTLAWTQAVVDRWEIACRKYLNVPGWQARFLAPGFPSPFAVLREAASAAR